MNELDFIAKRFWGAWTTITHCRICLRGEDVVSFLQGQTTNCVKTLNLFDIQYNSLLNRFGRIEFFFQLYRNAEKEFWIYCAEAEVDELIKRLEQFLVADDVSIEKFPVETDIVVVGRSELASTPDARNFLWFLEPAMLLTKLPEQLLHLPQLIEAEISNQYYLRGFFSLKQLDKNPVLNETVAAEIAWKQDKGCFLGQEVVQKIFSRRGAARLPFLIETDDMEVDLSIVNKTIHINEELLKVDGIGLYEGKKYLALMLPRSLQLDMLRVEIKFDDKKIIGCIKKIMTLNSDMSDFYHHAINLYATYGNASEAIRWLEALTVIQPNNSDYHEALGAIFGKEGKYQEAMEQMKIFAQLCPDQVMPYTNLSLYAMKLGQIELAESYKAEATVRTFSQFGKAASSKKIEEEKKKQDAFKLQEREKMFRDVLEIDPDDAMATVGMAEIEIMNQEWKAAQNRLERLMVITPQYTHLYIHLGQCYRQQGETQKARQCWTSGIAMALKNGELMPAQQMQTFLLQIESLT